MANLTITTVHTVQVQQQVTLPASVAIAQGQYIIEDTNGKWAIGNATTQGNVGRRAAIATKAVDAGMPLTGLVKGVMDVGNALSALAFDAQVFLSDTVGGVLADTAGTVSKVVGTVRPAWGATAADKLLFVDL